MIKRLLIVALLLLVNITVLLAQKKDKKADIDHTRLSTDSTEQTYQYKNLAPISKPSRDFLMLQFNYNTWLQKPDSIKTKGFGYGFNGYLCYDFPIKKSKLSFATGLGVNVSVVYLNQQVMRVSDTGVYGYEAHFVPEAIDSQFKRYKITTTYLTAPFELRYFSNTLNRNKGFKAAIGLQIGTLLGAGTKAVTTVEGVTVKYKTDTKRYMTAWNFAATARVGYGNITLFGSYNLTNVFKGNAGPTITPAAVGICFTGL